jgi:hypothetical protein
MRIYQDGDTLIVDGEGDTFLTTNDMAFYYCADVKGKAKFKNLRAYYVGKDEIKSFRRKVRATIFSLKSIWFA